MKKICVLSTGGTIAMNEDTSSGTVRPVSDVNLVSSIPNITQYANIVSQEVFNLPSPHLSVSHLEKLVSEVQKQISDPDIDGVVITHGTDTLEETSYFLDLQLPPGKPVIVTGAMRSSNELGCDGPANLLNSIRTAVEEEAFGQGVLVVLNEEIHKARYVTKSHTSNVASFQSPLTGPIGTLDKRSVLFFQKTIVHDHYPAKPIHHSVGLIKMGIGMDSQLLNYMIDDGIDGIVMEGLGLGNVPPNVVPGIQKAIQNEVPVILVSRCYNGSVRDVYGYEGGGEHLRKLGAIFTNGLNGQKARIKLMVLLANQMSVDSIRTAFENN